MKKVFLLFITIFTVASFSHASHIVGGDITVKWVGPSANDFQIQVTLFRSCQTGAAAMPTDVTVGLYDLSTYAISTNFAGFTRVVTPNLPFGDVCFTPTGLCIDQGVFTKNVSISNNPNGYFLSYDICCRNSGITNLANPSADGMTFYCEIPDPGNAAAANNSNPTWGIYPLDAYFCVNNPKMFQFNVTDADGDSLVYSLVEPLNDATAVTPPPAFPYNPIAWASGYSLGDMVGGASPMTINQNTGVITAAPSIIGTFVFGVRVEEFRNGIKIGETRRDVEYNSLMCSGSNNVASFTHVDNGAANYSFTNTSTGSNDLVLWNFGDGGFSPIQNPNHTFSNNGTYAVVLTIADSSALSGANCSMDYAVSLINVTGVTNPLACNAGFTIYPDTTILNNFTVVNSATGNNLTYLWDFGDGNTSNQPYPSYTYSNNGPYYLCLTVDNGAGCVDMFCDSISSGGIVFKQTGFTINIVAPSIITGINSNIELSSELDVYPNPTSNQLTIDVELNISEINILDIVGEKIMTLKESKNIINVSDLPSGIYFIQVTASGKTITKKFVKQ